MSEPTTEADFIRPTPEHIAGLFRAYEMIPRQRFYLERFTGVKGCMACAVGALLVESRGGVDEAFSYRQQEGFDYAELTARSTGWPLDFVTGIDHGFTTFEPGEEPADKLILSDTDLYREGFAIGWKAWELVEARA